MTRYIAVELDGIMFEFPASWPHQVEANRVSAYAPEKSLTIRRSLLGTLRSPLERRTR